MKVLAMNHAELPIYLISDGEDYISPGNTPENSVLAIGTLGEAQKIRADLERQRGRLFQILEYRFSGIVGAAGKIFN